MKPGVWGGIAWGVVLESVRRKDLWVVAILGGLVVAFAGLLGIFGFSGLEIFAKDLAVSVLSLFSTFLTVIVACRVIPDEVRNRTLYPLLARPISRFDFLVGKFFGAVLVSWVAFLVLALLTGVALATFGVGWEAIMAQFVLAKLMGLAMLCAVGLTISTFMTQQASVTVTLILALGSSTVTRALQMAYSNSGSSGQWGYKLLNAMLPQFSLFDLGGRVAYVGWQAAPMWVMLALAAYMAIYSSCMIGFAWLKFRKQGL